MSCPFCGLEGHRRALHAHMAARHAERVVTGEDAKQRLSYELACPVILPGGPACPTVIRRLVNPRNRDPRFLEENAAEIRLVAFDQLLYHLEEAHGEPAAEALGKERS